METIATVLIIIGVALALCPIVKHTLTVKDSFNHDPDGEILLGLMGGALLIGFSIALLIDIHIRNGTI